MARTGVGPVVLALGMLAMLPALSAALEVSCRSHTVSHMASRSVDVIVETFRLCCSRRSTCLDCFLSGRCQLVCSVVQVSAVTES